MIGSLVVLVGKIINGQKGHVQSSSVAEAPSKVPREAVIIYSCDYAFLDSIFFFFTAIA